MEFEPDGTDDNLLWSSSDETIATVADGVVEGVSGGQVTITATTDGGLSAEVVVNVTDVEAD